jgi:outer membrane protein
MQKNQHKNHISMKIHRITAVLLLATGLYSFKLTAQADSVLRFSLEEAQLYSIENFFQSKNSALDVEAAKKKILEMTSLGLPQVSASANYQHIPGEIPSFELPLGPNGELVPVEFYQKNNTQYGVNLNQLIFSGEYIVGVQASRVYKLFTEQNYERVKIDVKQGVASTYYGVLILKSNLSAIEQSIENLKLMYDQSVQTLNAGMMEDTDVDQINLTLKNTENTMTSLRNSIQYMQRLLKYQLGLPEEASVELTDSLETLIERNIISAYDEEFNLDENIEYQIVSSQERLRTLNMKIEQTKYLPSLSGFYNYTNNTNQPDFPPPVNHYLGLSLNFNILQSGYRHARVQQAKIALMQTQNLKEEEVIRLNLVAQQAVWNYESALNTYLNEKLNIELSQRVLDKTSIKYKEGVVSSLDLTQVNNQFLVARRTYTTAAQSLLDAKIALDKAYNRL